MSRLFITRYARYNPETNELSTQGQEDVSQITQNLLHVQGVDPNRCILLASTVRFAIDTSLAVQQQLDNQPGLIISTYLRRAGLWPQAVENFYEYFSSIAKAALPAYVNTNDYDTVAITHGQLIRTASGVPTEASYGQVYQLTADQDNPTFDPLYAARIEENLNNWSG